MIAPWFGMAWHALAWPVLAWSWLPLHIKLLNQSLRIQERQIGARTQRPKLMTIADCVR